MMADVEHAGARGGGGSRLQGQGTLHSWEGLLLTLSASALWGLAPVLTKGALAGFSPELIAVVRLGVGATLCRLMAGPDTPWLIRERWLLLAGLALGADFVLYNYGLQRTSASVAGLLVNVEVLSTIALAVWLLGERVDLRRLLGCLITLGGAVYLSLSESPNQADIGTRQLAGNLLVMASAACWSVYAVAQRRSSTDSNLFARLSTIFLVAGLTALPPCLRGEAWKIDADWHAWLMLAGLSLFCTFAVYWIYARAQQLSDVSVLAILLCTIPVFSVIFAALLLGEPITRQLLVGGLIIVSGIAVLASASLPVSPWIRRRSAD